MPITSQAKKAMRRDAKKQIYNLRSKRAMKKISKEIRDLVSGGKHKNAETKLSQVYKAIDKAAKRGVIKKNTAARKKSRLTRLVSRAAESRTK